MARKTKDQQLLEQQILNTAVLANALNKSQVTAQAMVGIRNISDLTFGQASWSGNPEIHLHAGVNPNDPNTVGIIPFAWWRELRKSRWVDQGIIMRDDTVLGEGYMHSPEDRPEDLAPNFKYNAIIDPKAWIDSRNETEIRADLLKITSINSLRRIRRAIDDKIKADAAAMPDTFRDMTPASNGKMPAGGWDLRKVKALDALPALYRLTDDLVTKRLEELINASYYSA